MRVQTVSPNMPALNRPDWFQLRECLRERRFDGRWSTEVIAAFDDGDLLGALPIATCRGGTIPDANIRLELRRVAPAAAPIEPRRLIFLGGHAYLRGGVCLAPTVAGPRARTVTAALVRCALAVAQARSLVPHALFLPDDQLEAMAAAWRPPPRTLEAPPVAFLAVGPYRDLDAFAAALPGAARDNWRSDRSRLEVAGVDAIAVKLTEDLIAEAAPSIAAGKIGSGVADHPRLTAIRLRSWLSGVELSLTRAWEVRDRNAALLGISIGVVNRGVLQVVELGLVPSHAWRREIYLELAFRAPVRACLADGLIGVELGAGSLPTKRRRGAVLLRRWHLMP